MVEPSSSHFHGLTLAQLEIHLGWRGQPTGEGPGQVIARLYMEGFDIIRRYNLICYF